MARLARFLPRRVAAAEPLAAALADHFHTGRPRRVGAQRADGLCFEIETEEYLTLAGRLAELDRIALDACRGRVLDVGAGAGRHALALEASGHAVVAVDVSPTCVALCRERGVVDARVLDVTAIGAPGAYGRFDTIFFGMQTIGVAGDLVSLVSLLERLRAWLAEGGRILADSSALREPWRGEAVGARSTLGGSDVDAAEEGTGEIVLATRYRGWRGEPFHWLYVGERAMARAAARAGYDCEVLARVDEGEYLACLTPWPAEGSREM